MNTRFHKHINNLNISQVTLLVFLLIILLGALLLSLPAATKAPGSCGFLTSLFTATSAVCVTGLSLVDIYTTFSFFGQVVLILLVEIGGLGFMSVVSLLFHVTRRKNNIQTLSLMAQSLGSDGIKNVMRLQKRLLLVSLLAESVGALLLSICFARQMPLKDAIWYGIFHAISAFCNAGFDLMGQVSPGSSMETLQNNPVILLTIAALIIIGGIGFIVWDDIVMTKNPKKWSINTKLVLSMTGFLLFAGTLAFLGMEYNNPDTMGNMSFGYKLLHAFFQSASTRTAGFGAVNQGTMTKQSIVLTVLLMLIGGSAGSTAGGIKTVTFLVAMKSIITYLTGKSEVTLMHRTLVPEQIAQAYALLGGFAFLGISGGFFLSLSSNLPYISALFESVSALATVGLSLGITSSVSLASKIMLICFMFIGRVGLLTITVGFFKGKENKKIKYPSVKIMIG
ncbi:MAG: TrkH family potassium uptake protein [Lachnospiraceae bacterium]